jgi:hypothetical protein
LNTQHGHAVWCQSVVEYGLFEEKDTIVACVCENKKQFKTKWNTQQGQKCTKTNKYDGMRPFDSQHYQEMLE